VDPACVETCPTGARAFGDLDDPNSPVRRAIFHAGRAETLKPETGAHPKLYYLNSRFTNTDLDDVRGTVISFFNGGHGAGHGSEGKE
jgi:Fe-S-cluster-containing dehydrogenase component